MAPRNTPCGTRDFASRETVFAVAAQAYLLTSVAQARISGRPNIAQALAARNARTMPDPEPTSTTSGEGVRGAKRVRRNAVSVDEERVSSRR